MDVKVFFKENDFHDSLIEKIEYDKNINKILIEIEFCNWFQDWYDENIHSETELKMLEFNEVSQVEIPKGLVIDSDSILQIEINGKNRLKIVFLNDETEDVVAIEFNCLDMKW